jgi:DNA-binding transcriptional MocR family regulator
VQLATELRDAIDRGVYRPGDRLPTSRQLAQDNGIAIMTVRHAFQVLRDEGLIVGQRGRGIFVTGPSGPAAAGEARPGPDAAAAHGGEVTGEDADRASDASALEPVRDTLDLALSQLDAMGDLEIDIDSAIENIRQARAALDVGRSTDAGFDPHPDPGLEPDAGLGT